MHLTLERVPQQRVETSSKQFGNSRYSKRCIETSTEYIRRSTILLHTQRDTIFLHSKMSLLLCSVKYQARKITLRHLDLASDQWRISCAVYEIFSTAHLHMCHLLNASRLQSTAHYGCDKYAPAIGMEGMHLIDAPLFGRDDNACDGQLYVRSYSISVFGEYDLIALMILRKEFFSAGLGVFWLISALARLLLVSFGLSPLGRFRPCLWVCG